MLSLRRSTVFTRPRSSIDVGRGATLKLWSSPHWNGSTGSTTAAFWSPSGISRQPRQKNDTTPCWTCQPWPHNLNQKVSGKAGTVQIGICEERGSGIDRALYEIEKHALPPPLFQQVEDTTVVTLFGPKAFADMSKEDRIRACYQHACLGFEKNDYMSNASLRKRFGLTDKQYPQVSIVLAEAKDAGTIRPLDEDQANRNARYVPYWA